RVGVIVTGCVLPGDQGPGPCRRPGSRPACGRSLLAGLSCQENLGTSRPVALPTTRNFVSDEKGRTREGAAFFRVQGQLSRPVWRAHASIVDHAQADRPPT